MINIYFIHTILIISIRSCFEAFTEIMAGETQLLELRRHYHCAAYNCAIAVISCSFNEPKFYYGFLFSEKPEKVLDSLNKYITPAFQSFWYNAVQIMGFMLSNACKERNGRLLY